MRMPGTSTGCAGTSSLSGRMVECLLQYVYTEKSIEAWSPPQAIHLPDALDIPHDGLEPPRRSLAEDPGSGY